MLLVMIFLRACSQVMTVVYQAKLPSLPDLVISEHGILTLLLKLDIKKAPEPDGISNCFFKVLAEWCAKYIVY